jgi:hypothetical protein
MVANTNKCSSLHSSVSLSLHLIFPTYKEKQKNNKEVKIEEKVQTFQGRYIFSLLSRNFHDCLMATYFLVQKIYKNH